MIFIRCTLPLLCLFSLTSALWAEATFNKKGVLSYGETTWGTMHMNQRWQPSTQDRNFSPQESNSGNVQGPFADKSGAKLFEYSQQASGKPGDSLQITVSVQNPDGIQSNMLAYEGLLPIKQFAGATIQVDDEAFELPHEFKGEQTLFLQAAKKVSVPTIDGLITFHGHFTVMLVDARKFGGSDFALRFFYNPHKGEFRTSDFKARISFEEYQLKKLSLAAASNRSFADPVAGDGQGGWTDQGPQQDLAAFSNQSEIAGTIQFEIPDTGNTTLVLSNDPKRSELSYGQIDVPASYGSPKYLYLLHASAYTWGQVGRIKVSYQDGSEQVIQVQSSQDVGNWWNPVDSPNAAIVWSDASKGANVGLYESRFELQGKPIERIAFGAGNDSIWMIVGATLSDTAIALPQPEFYVIQENEDWAPIETPLTVEPNSALDFSSWNHTPAGKYGAVITTPDGHFAFEDVPQTPVRFLGTNLNFDANYLTKTDADALALRLRQMGYNTTRIHHYDVLLAGGWNPKQYTLSNAQQDKLDYLFYALKEQGIYISTDLFTIRRIRNEKLPQLNSNNHAAFKAMIPISKDAMDEWKRFARDLLTHKNPYTGMTWGEDPALFSICPVNEDTIWAAINADKSVKAMYQDGFKKWIQSNPRPVGSDEALGMAMNEYLAEVQMTADAEMRRFLKEELGVKALLTGNNWKYHYAQTPIRAQYDYVDNHGYWDHPSFPKGPWNLPYSNSQKSATKDLANVPRRMFLTRIEDKPFMVTEYNFSYPNKFRNESGPLMGTYSALQDHDGLYRFSWAHYRDRINSQQPVEGFDIVQDPIGLLSEYIIAMLWRRADVPPLEKEAVYVVNKERAFATGDTTPTPTAEDIYKLDAIDDSKLGQRPPDFDMHASYLGLTTRISSRYEANADTTKANSAFSGLHPENEYVVKSKEAKATLERAGNFLVETPYSKAMIVQSGSLNENFVREVQGGPATLFIGSIDHQPLETSKRLLVLHLTNVLNKGMKFGDKGMYQLQDLGSAVKLVKRGSATITIPNQSNQAKVYTLDLSGQRTREVPFEYDSNGNIVLKVETISTDHGTQLAYEVVR